MEVKRSEAIDLCQGLGYKLVNKTYSNEKLGAKLNKLAEIPEEDLTVATRDLDEDQKELFNKVMDANATDEEITVFTPEGEEDVEVTKKGKKVSEKTNGKHKPEKEKDGKGKKIMDKVKEKAEKNKAELDKFGCRKTSNCSKLNAVLSSKAKSLEEIQEEAGIKYPPIANHMKKLIDKGYVTKTEDKKYKLVKLSKVSD